MLNCRILKAFNLFFISIQRLRRYSLMLQTTFVKAAIASIVKMTSDRSCDLLKSQCIKDTVEKEEAARMKFYLQNKAAGKLSSNIKHSKQYEVFKKRLGLQSDSGPRQHIARLATYLNKKESDNCMKRQSYLMKQFTFREPDDSVIWQYMRPVSPEVRKFIYNGVSHEFQGR